MNDDQKNGGLIREILRPLPHLPVTRETYCSQEMTDNLVDFLQKNKIDLLEILAESELQSDKQGRRDSLYGRATGRIIEFIRNEVAGDINIPQTRLGMLYFIFELSKRIRSVMTLSEILPLGKPLAPTPQGPFPVLEKIPVSLMPDGNAYPGCSQSEVDEVIEDIYHRQPEIIYEYAEQIRLQNFSYEIMEEIRKLLKLNPDIKTELTKIIIYMCEIHPIAKERK